MKKRKIFAYTIASTLAGLSLGAIVASTTTVATNTTNQASGTLNSINYTRVTFNTVEDVTISGPNYSKARVGARFSSVSKPVATHASNYRFLGWSTVKGDEKEIVKDSTTIPSDGLSLYPVFEIPANLSNCLCISAIEDSTVTINFQKTPTPMPTNEERTKVDMAYSTDFGANWHGIEYSTTEGEEGAYTWTSATIPANGCIYIKGNNPLGLSTAAGNYTHITFTGKVNLFGNAMGLINNGSLESQKYKSIPCAYCFYHLFENATAIEYVADNFFPCEGDSAKPTEEVKTLKAHCYEGAFTGCSSMVHAPRLFATTAAVLGDADNDTTNCYKDIFSGCSLVDYVRVRYEGDFDSADKNQFDGWVNGVASTGTFTYNGPDTASKFGFGTNWTAKLTPKDGANEDVKITADSPSECTVDKEYEFKVTCKRSDDTTGKPVEQGVYWLSSNETIASIDHKSGKLTGHPYDYKAEEGYKKVTITAFSKANLNACATKEVTIVPITLTKCTSVKALTDTKFSVTYSGSSSSIPTFKYSTDEGKNWMDVVFNENIDIKAGDTIYLKGNNPDGLCDGTLNSHTQFLTNEGEIELGGDIKALIYGGEEGDEIPCDYCFNNLFANTNVKKVNSGFLSFTTLTKGCYWGMFSECKKLTDLPADLLPAGKDSVGSLADYCYRAMFYGCDHLTDQIPDLPATDLKQYCYEAMFYECYSLTRTIELPAKTPATNCYAYMFQSCNNLESIGKISLESLTTKACLQTFCLDSWNNIEISEGEGELDKLIFTCPTKSGTDSTTFMFGDDTYKNYPTSGNSYYWKVKQ